MMLPPQLAPWSAWLSLLPLDLVAPLGQMLLRLQPLVGRMAGVAASADDIPAGVGSIARRGPYERMLLSEWGVLDAAPDEFIRRAAAHELLFSAPEPQVQRRARVCVALFDAGPEQLGEPRLVQMALFILLARRAQLDGASFEWGILQTPGPLHADCDQPALERLMNARTVARVGSAERDGWNRCLAQVDLLADVWQIDGPGAGVLHRMTARASIEQPLLDERLQVTITQQGRARQLMLDLPDPASAVRLMRHPGNARLDKMRDRIGGHDTPSLKHAPIFSLGGHSVVTARADGGSLHFQVSDVAREGYIAPRRQRRPKKGSVIGLTAVGSTVSCSKNRVWFNQFHGAFHARECPLPPPEQFTTPRGTGQRLPTFHMNTHDTGGRIFVLDAVGRLVCWSAVSTADANTVFEVIATGVVGVVQTGDTLVWARIKDSCTTLECYRDGAVSPREAFVFSGLSTRVLFGDIGSSKEPRSWRIAAAIKETTWLLGQGKEQCNVEIDDGATVIGVTRSEPADWAELALLVLDPSRRCVELRGETQRRVVLTTTAPIAQVTLDPASDRFCWILSGTHELFVRHLHDEQALLHVIPDGVPDAP
ncbi:hypothetical protein [Massilia pseudoviolaceinigra]|uniref:hypothetical protein n=1 Tax=Massilia pseudoviolaceinigra TaxID=3057165 RepID=UPI002796B7DE|nr:hypothetical protein [Massilia sp. CCM 9206]MDQ1919628.1 hypothetical protein [Massilia sp. CCM 9206]